MKWPVVLPLALLALLWGARRPTQAPGAPGSPEPSDGPSGAPGPAPEPLWPLGGRARVALWGEMPYRELEGGSLEIDPSWLAEWITEVPIPELGGRRVRVHREFVEPVRAWLRDARTEGLIDGSTVVQIDQIPRLSRRYGVPGLYPSAHAYGVAVDLDPERYPEGSRGDARAERLARLAARHGMGWGGMLDDPDPHHFELVRRQGRSVS